jgi:hypothetical protein
MFEFQEYPFLSFYTPGAKALIAVAIIWTLIWKGIALWKAGQAGHKPWFIALFLTNTLGVLDIVYLIWFAGNQKTSK